MPDHDAQAVEEPAAASAPTRRPNILFVFADQWRASATGYSGNPDVQTPHLDALASEGVTFTTAVANCPVCTPYRASLLTGRYPLSTGLFVNDVRLPESEITIAEVLATQGHDTAYIGKWHLDGPERSAYTPPGPRRQGFDFWAVGNCTHQYLHSLYYRGDDPTPRTWEGYDAHAQADLAIDYIEAHGRERPFCLFLSWGPPHNPYDRVPQRYLDLYDPSTLTLPANVPPEWRTERTRRGLAGYYAHITALDESLGRILAALEGSGQAENTVLVFTSDHGDMLGSQGRHRKQWPWDESIRVPLVVRYPRRQGDARLDDTPFSVVDLLPTLLALCGAPIPEAVEGTSLAHLVTGEAGDAPEEALIASIAPFSEAWPGPEWRGVRTRRYTYARTLEGPWLLYDNAADPAQCRNLIAEPGYAALRADLDERLAHWLRRTGDAFLPGAAHMAQYGYPRGDKGEVPYVL